MEKQIFTNKSRHYVEKHGRGNLKSEKPVFDYDNEKPIDFEGMKRYLESYLKNAPNIEWSDIRAGLARALSRLTPEERTLLEQYFKQIKQTGIKETIPTVEVDPVFSQVAIFINKELQDSEGKEPYENIIVKFFIENEGEPIIDGITDPMMKRFEDYYEKVVLKYIQQDVEQVTSPEEMEKIATNWIKAFNERSIDNLLYLYDKNAVHYSPRLLKLKPETGGRIQGRNEMRDWWEDAFVRLPTLRYSKISFDITGDVILVTYNRHVDGEQDTEVKETLKIQNGKIVESKVL